MNDAEHLGPRQNDWVRNRPRLPLVLAEMTWRAFLAAAIIGTACNLPGDSVTSQPSPSQSAAVPGTQSPSPTIGGSATRDPRDLTRHPEESAVVDAILAAGYDVAQIGASKFEGYFAEWKRGRVFYNNYQTPFRVDALFLDSPLSNVRVCRVPGFGHDYSIVIDGRPATVGATAEVFFAVGNQFFVMTSQPAIHDSLIARLRLAVPSC
jgi:hypothetical protein